MIERAKTGVRSIRDSAALLVFVLDQVRRDRLYVGYGVVLVTATIGVLTFISIPALLAMVTRMVGAALPTAALTLLGLTFVLFVLVHLLTQVTLVSNRVAAVVQELAIRGATEDARQGLQERRTDPEGR